MSTPKNTQAQKVMNKSLTKVKQPFTHPVVIGLVLVAVIVIPLFILRTISHNTTAVFERATSNGNTAIAQLTSQIHTEPIYVDRASVCYKQSQDEFSGKKLYCETTTAAYYKLNNKNSSESARSAATILGMAYGVTLDRLSSATEQEEIYNLYNQKLESLNNLECAMSIRYPESSTRFIGLPARSFSDGDVMSMSMSCSKQMRSPIYPMINI